MGRNDGRESQVRVDAFTSLQRFAGTEYRENRRAYRKPHVVLRRVVPSSRCIFPPHHPDILLCEVPADERPQMTHAAFQALRDRPDLDDRQKAAGWFRNTATQVVIREINDENRS